MHEILGVHANTCNIPILWWTLLRHMPRVIVSRYGTRSKHLRLISSCRGGTTLTKWNGDGVWWVSRCVALFNCCKSTVRLGEPSFFGTVTMCEHQVVGVPVGTGAMMWSATSESHWCYTASFQWCRTGIGLWIATGSASGMNDIVSGVPVIAWSFWWGQSVESTSREIRFYPLF